jgi:hypothetical protein
MVCAVLAFLTDAVPTVQTDLESADLETAEQMAIGFLPVFCRRKEETLLVRARREVRLQFCEQVV